MDAIHAVAEAWASIDGKLPDFKREQANPFQVNDTGTYLGYLAEAQEMIRRIEARGFTVVARTE